ncbi:glycosyltransferase [Acinetobacter indicus]|uniref:glycosyltransferase n=1 Tax=Acinetobacter indicus TaxID=756892 RepID=UPI00144406FE|nr:glycosyltransferase [Acinetobacter indicus]
MKIKRILHITAVRELGSGQRNQLIYEVNAAKKIPKMVWHTLAYHSGKSVETFERSIPWYFDYLILRNLFFWLIVLKFSKKYDLVLLRHIAFDPFALIFSPFIKNRVSIHHAKEIDELKLVRAGIKGKLASFVEKITGKVAVKNSLMVAGVTKEIAIYENEERGLSKPIVVYPNGVEVEQIRVAEDNRITNEYNILFMCSYFSEWHGLDILLKSLDDSNINENFFIHLVGNLSNQQLDTIKNNKYKERIIIHGVLSKVEYLKIVSKCDVGLGSLAMYRQNLKEGSTLKVREMLAMGLPVFSGHKDVAFDNDFQYYKYSENFVHEELMQFAQLHKKSNRVTVRDAAKKFIDKEKIIIKFISQLNF